MIVFRCPHCQKSINAAAKLARKLAACPRCDAPIQVPDEDTIEIEGFEELVRELRKSLLPPNQRADDNDLRLRDDPQSSCLQRPRVRYASRVRIVRVASGFLSRTLEKLFRKRSSKLTRQ